MTTQNKIVRVNYQKRVAREIEDAVVNMAFEYPGYTDRLEQSMNYVKRVSW